MKKNYLLGLGILLATGVSAQVAKNAPQRIEKAFTTTAVGNKADGTFTPKAGGDTVWYNNFNNAADWVIDNNGQTGAGFGWNINATEDSWWTTQVINSVSDGNFAEVNNGNPTLTPGTQALDVIYTLTTATPIAITTNNLTLSFLQYGARFNDAQEMYISTDGTTWTLVGDNSDQPVLSAAGGAPYANPTEKSINLASNVPASATQIWVRFSWTTGFPASATNPNVWITYGWMIDDVKITETYADDLSLKEIVWGVDNGFETMPYYRTPISQVQPIKIGGVVENAGSSVKTDAVFKGNITSASFAGESAASTINAYDVDTLFTTADFTPSSSIGAYVMNGFEVETALDEIPSNNAIAAPINFEVTQFTYARDRGTKTGTFNNQGDGYQLCNQFDIFVGGEVGGVDFFVDPTTTTGAVVYVNIQTIGAEFEVVEQSDNYTILNGDKNKFISLPFSSVFNTADMTSYLVCVGSYGGVTPNDLIVGTSGVSAPQTSFLYDEAVSDWFYTTSTPMVRLNFNPDLLSTSNLSNEFVTVGNVFPNPTNGTATVEFALNASAEVALEVLDITGKVVYTNNAGTLNSGANSITVDASAFQAGVYYVNILTNGTSVTKKLIKE